MSLEAFLSRAKTSRRNKTPSVVNESILAFSDTKRIIGDSDSVLSSTTFDFDDIVVNSRAYREAMQTKQKRTNVAHEVSLPSAARSSSSVHPVVMSPKETASSESHTMLSPTSTNQLDGDLRDESSPSLERALLPRDADITSSISEELRAEVDSQESSIDADEKTTSGYQHQTRQVENPPLERHSSHSPQFVAGDNPTDQPLSNSSEPSAVLPQEQGRRQAAHPKKSIPLYLRLLNSRVRRSESPALRVPTAPAAATEKRHVLISTRCCGKCKE